MLDQEPQLFPRQCGRYFVYLDLQGDIVIVAPEDAGEMSDDEAAGIFEYLLSRTVLFTRVFSNRKVGQYGL